MNAVNPHFMPSLSIPVSLCTELEDYEQGDKINGAFSYEVVGKDEYGIQLKITHIAPSVKLRKF